MRRTGVLAAAALCALDLASGPAVARLRIGDGRGLAVDRILSPAVQPLEVASPAAEPGKSMPELYTAFGRNVSPPVSWRGAPPATRSFVVVIEDADGPEGAPTLQWLVYDIPGTAEGLPRDLKVPAGVGRGKREVQGPTQGRNYAGGVGYVGPNPPPGEGPHHYHIEVFALGKTLKLKQGARLSAVLAAMNEAVLAQGEAVAVFAAPAAPRADEPGG